MSVGYAGSHGDSTADSSLLELSAGFDIKRPDWMIPGTDFEKRVLNALGMKYYPRKEVGGKDMHTQLALIAKSLVSLKSGVVSQYPMEWVIAVLQWFQVKKLRGHKALRRYLNVLCGDVDWRNSFVREWQKKHQRHIADYAAPPTEHEDVMRYLVLPDE